MAVYSYTGTLCSKKIQAEVTCENDSPVSQMSGKKHQGTEEYNFTILFM